MTRTTQTARQHTLVTDRRPQLRHSAQLGPLFQQSEFSDADMFITARSDGNSSSKVTKIAFPVHLNIVATSSKYFAAQASSWREREPGERVQLSMSVQPGLQEAPAAVAFIRAMYSTESLYSASREHLAVIMMLAEEHGASIVASNAVQLLAAAGASLTAAAVAKLVQLPSWPRSLLPLTTLLLRRLVKLMHEDAAPKASYKQWVAMLVANEDDGALVDSTTESLDMVFGNLDAVWKDAALKSALLQLPMPAMQLLLQQPDLQVACEDTVFYTVQQYCKAQPGAAAEAAAREALLRLVRYPQLSRACLTSVAGPAAAALGTTHMQQVFRLLQLQQLRLKDNELQDALDAQPGHPDCWYEGPRDFYNYKPQTARVSWHLDHSQLKALCSAPEQQRAFLRGPDSPPAYGVSWHVRTNGARLEICSSDVSPPPLFRGCLSLQVFGGDDGKKELFSWRCDAGANLLQRSGRYVAGVFALEGAADAAAAKVVVPAAGTAGGKFRVELQVQGGKARPAKA